MKKQSHVIKSIVEGSIAEELELEPGDVLVSINGNKITDVFDYHFLVNDEYLEVVVRKPDGEEWELEIEKDYEDDLGIEFENGLMDDYKSCHNKCMFCFIDQMPKGMRETLYFKDDDSRLSFLQGNYVTLTNMKDSDVERIIKYKLSPINISVHTTNRELRCKMLNNRFAGDALDILDKLNANNVEMNGQVVLCKGVNDGEELERTISDLEKYIPNMQSASVVPSGLTKYREGLYPLTPFNRDDARKVIETIRRYQNKFYEKYGVHFIQASDEWYSLAGYEMPQEDMYDGYLQLENGVGMIRLLLNEFREGLRSYKGDDREHTISIATGVLAYDYIKLLADELMAEFKNVKVIIYKIINNFFGENITVSGLITGQDLIAQLTGKELGDILYLPANILRSGEDVFLDDLTLTDVKNALQSEIGIVKSNGNELVKAMLKEN